VFFNQTTTITNGVVTFEVSDTTGFTNAYPIQCVQANANVVSLTYTFVASTNQVFECDVAGFTAFQVRLSTQIAGTATVNVSIISTKDATQPDVTVGGTIAGTLANNGTAAATNRIATLPGIAQTSYNNGTATTQGRDVAANVGTDGLLWTAQLPAIRPASYHASASFAGSSTTDNAVMPGNASNTVLVTKIMVSCTQTTAGMKTVTIIKRSAADTGGTSAAMTAVPDDSNYSAAVSAPLSYTSTGPSAGAAVGNIDSYQLGCMAAATASPNDIYVLNLRQKPIVLRGTAQQLAVNFGNAAITGGNLTVTFEWIETTTITP
jgi:hypothetical protein